MPKRILVTGGAGFLGSFLCENLLAQGHFVSCWDNFYTGSLENLISFLDNPNFQLIEQDLIEPLDLPVDQILHFACPASPPHYQKDAVYTTKTCFLGTLNMLELAKTHQARLLLASTSEVYGNPTCHTQSESYFGNVNPISIRSCYDEGKRISESLAFDFHRQYGVDIRIVRIFNTYGPRMQINDGRVVSNLIVQALKNIPLTLYGNGQQTRSFCYVTDLIAGIISMLNHPNFLGPVNLGDPKITSMNQLANTILELTQSTSSLSYQPMPESDPTHRKPDISLAKKELNWQPKVDLEQGIVSTIQYFKSKLS